MYEVVLLNKEGKRFTKTFNGEYLFSEFLRKVKHSKTLKIVSYGRIN